MAESSYKNLKTELTLSIEELIMVLNELYIDSQDNLKVVDGLYNLDLLNVDISETIKLTLLSSLNTIDKAYNSISKEHSKDICSEFPQKSRYFEIFEKSGLYFELFHKSAFEKVLREIDKCNILQGDLPIVFAFDTNMYFSQFFNQLSILLKKKFGNRRSPISFLLSEGVKQELSKYEWKYTNKELDPMKKLCPNSDLLDEFSNQNTLDSRLWHLGHIDFLKCLKETHSKSVDIDDAVESEFKDLKIIEGLNKEVKQQNIKLYLFSKDSDFIARAQGHRNIVPVFIETIPQKEIKDSYTCDWETLLRLLYNLSITFGVIKLEFKRGNSILIYGIWRGKKFQDWECEVLKLKASNPILTRVEKDLKILRKVGNET